MGNDLSQATYRVPEQRKLLGRCVMITDDKKLEALRKQWFSRGVFPDDALLSWRFKVSDELQPTTDPDNVWTYRTRYKLEIHTGVDLMECVEKGYVWACLNGQIGREAPATSIAGVSLELVPIAKAEQRRLETHGRSAHFVVAAVSNFELSIEPSEDGEDENKDGDGFITRVRYGGYVIVETDKKNVEPIARSLSCEEPVPLEGDVVAHVKIVGGHQTALAESFNGCVNELVGAVKKWTDGLKKNPGKSKAIAVCVKIHLQVYMSKKFGWDSTSSSRVFEELEELIEESQLSAEEFFLDNPPPSNVEGMYLLNGYEVTPEMYVAKLRAEKKGESNVCTESADPAHSMQPNEPAVVGVPPPVEGNGAAVEKKIQKDDVRTMPNEPTWSDRVRHWEVKRPKPPLLPVNPVPVPQVDEEELSKHMARYGWGRQQQLANTTGPNVIQRLLAKIRQSGEGIESFLTAYPPPANEGGVFVLRIGKKAFRLTPAAYVRGSKPVPAIPDIGDFDFKGEEAPSSKAKSNPKKESIGDLDDKLEVAPSSKAKYKLKSAVR